MIKRSLFFFILLLFQLIARAQPTAIIIREDFAQTPLSRVLQRLEDKYQLQLAYEAETLDGIIINQKIDGLPLEAALNRLLQPHGLDFVVLDGNKVLIRPGQGPAPAETTYQISGQAIDGLRGEPLPYATLWCESLKTGTSADAQGRFQMEIPQSTAEVRLQVQFLGYEAKTFSFSPASTYHVLRLAAVPQQLGPVTVSSLPPAISTRKTAQGLTLDAGQLSRLPAFAGGNDLMRQLQFLPGISAHDDLSANLRIRGSADDENMVLLDGITLYRVGHFFGIFSAVNSAAIDEVKLYRNAFPAEFGGRTAGVIQMSSKNPETPAFSGNLEFNLLLANAYLSLPLSKNMNLMLSGRITNRDVGNTQLYGLIEQPGTISSRFGGSANGFIGSDVIGLEPDFRFYDSHVKWAWRPSAKSDLTAAYFRGYDAFRYAFEQGFTQRIRNQLVRNTEVYSEETDWTNTGASLQWRQQWSTKWQSDLLLSYSSFQTDGAINSSLLRSAQEDSLVLAANGQSNKVEGLNLNWKNTVALTKAHSLAAGYNLTGNKVAFEIDIERFPVLQKQQQAAQHALYLEHKGQWGHGWTSTIGLRGAHYPAGNKVFFSPRLSLACNIDENWQLKGSLSRYQQFLREIGYEDRFGRNFGFWVLADEAEFPLAQANLAMLGFNVQKNGFELDVEAYAKHTDGQLAYALPTPGFGNNLTPPEELNYQLFKGQGNTIGLDVLLKKGWGPYSGWLAYTLSKTTQQFPEINNNEPFPSPDDRRHQLKLANLIQLGRWDFSATYVFASGRPYIDISRFDPMQDRREGPILPLINRLKDYHRADVGLSYRFPLLGAAGKAGASVYNLFNCENVKYRQYFYALPTDEMHMGPAHHRNVLILGSELQLLPRIFNLSFSVEF